MNGHSVAVLRRAATLAPIVLPAALAEIAADEIGIELDALDAGAALDSIDERVLRLAQEILSLLPADYAARARSEVQNAGWRPWSMEVAADLLNLITTWEGQGPGPEAAVLLAQVRELVQHPSARASPSGESHERGRGCPQE